MCKIKKAIRETTSGDAHSKEVFNWLVDSVKLLRYSVLVAITIFPIFSGLIIYIYLNGMANIDKNHNIVLSQMSNNIEINKESIYKIKDNLDGHRFDYSIHYFANKIKQ